MGKLNVSKKEYATVGYLGGAIMHCNDTEVHDWRKQLQNPFLYSGHSIMKWNDPAKRDYRNFQGEHKTYPSIPTNEIVNLDKRDILESDIFICRYIKPSVGTSMEVMFAWLHNIPVIVWADIELELSPWLIYHSSCVTYSLEECVEKIQLYSEFNRRQ